MKTNKGKKNTSATAILVKHEHPGRPRYTMLFPSTLTFTFTELMRANGVDTRKYAGNGHENRNYGKGENATMLTIRKNIKFDLARGEVYLMKGYTAVPDSDDGLGRRGLLYRHKDTAFSKALAEAKIRGAEGLTDEVSAPKAKATRKSRKSDTAAVNKTIADAQAILAEPASTVVIAPVAPSTIPDAVHNPIVAPAPVAETAPVAPVTPAAAAPEVSVPIAEPVVPTPAPAAPVAETAPVVPAETAPVAA